MPPNYYNALGYYSPLYAKRYFNGYGYNFYYRKTGYYADSPNAVSRSDVVLVNNGGSGIGGLVGLCFCCCIVGVIVFLIFTGRCKRDDDDDSHSEHSHESVHEETIVEEEYEEEVHYG